jgi:glycolate oxidase iron-sulfur subunit
MTPPIEARSARGLEGVARSLPPGASAVVAAGALVLKPAGAPRARVGFFTTCVMEAMFPRVNREAARLLVLSGCEVVSPLSQSCCGALQAHAGLRRRARELARTNVRAFDGDYDFVVTDSAGCGAALREAGHLLQDDATAEAAARFAARVRDVSEVLAELGLPAPTASLAGRQRDFGPASGGTSVAATEDRSGEPADRPLRVAYHDPCHLAHAQNVRRQPRDLLAKLPGLELVPLPNSDWCCGSAGTYNLTHPEMAEAQLRQKLDSVERAAPDLVVASNPGCLLHMARGARERGMPARMVHLVEVLALAHPAPAGGEAHR